MPEPKPTLALDEPRKDATADRGGDQADEAGDAPAKATRRRTRTKDATGGTATRGSKRQRTGASPDDTPSGVDAVHEADHEDESVEAQDGKRKRRPRRRKRKTGVEGNTGSARSTSKSSRRQGAVLPTEVRNAIEVAPPRKMLVTRKDRTTQIAVLEDRTLVEHYVTQSHEQSFVGNIYKGRVQNVLPGMEAAFVDIGKGRNGVLYAGEVLYDEDDLDGQPARIE